MKNVYGLNKLFSNQRPDISTKSWEYISFIKIIRF